MDGQGEKGGGQLTTLTNWPQESFEVDILIIDCLMEHLFSHLPDWA